MKSLPFFAVMASAALLAGCNDTKVAEKPLNVVSGHIVLPATPDGPAVGYFRVQGGPQPVQLVAVTAALAQRVEMHESKKVDGVMTMEELPSADVPAGGELVFKQGGKHLMIWGINKAAVETGKLPMQFLFTNNNNERILFDLVIKPAANDGAAGGAGEATDHGAAAH